MQCPTHGSAVGKGLQTCHWGRAMGMNLTAEFCNRKNRSVFSSSVSTWNLPLSSAANLWSQSQHLCLCLLVGAELQHLQHHRLFSSAPLSTSQQVLPASDSSSPFCSWRQWHRQVPRTLKSPLPSTSGCPGCSCSRRDRSHLPPAETAAAWDPAENLKMPKLGFLRWALPQMHLLTVTSEDLQNKTLCRQHVGVGMGSAFITLTVHEYHGGDELTTYSRRLLSRYAESLSDTPRAGNTTQPASSAPFSEGETRNAGAFVCWVAWVARAMPVSAGSSSCCFAIRQ